jgi:hypothetical protein
MSIITLDQIEARQTELADMIAKFKTQPAPVVLTIVESRIELRAGERYAGVILNDDGTPAHHLVLLPGEAEDINWQDAMAWASNAGGELPTRREQSLLFANLGREFKAAWYWSAESHANDGSCAWHQYFNNGNQYYYHKSYEGRCRAVRRIKA